MLASNAFRRALALTRPTSTLTTSPQRRRRVSFTLELMEPRVLLSSVPFGADYRDNSEFMIGTVHVSVVLLESNGAVDANSENWSTTQIQKVQQQITAGVQWWEQMFTLQGTSHELSFQIDFTYANSPVQTSYEPITRNWQDQTLWIGEFLQQVGFKQTSSIFTDMRNWNHAQRQANDANWAFTVFVVDSEKDTDGKFANGASAYAYIGGPFVVMTYDNGGWGIDRMKQVFAHEVMHIFYALDEYSGSHSYYSHSGYYNTQNLNAFDNNPDLASRVTSLMSDGASMLKAYSEFTSSPSSLQAIGWRDSGGNGIYDVLDVPLTLSGSGGYDADGAIYSFSGSSSVGTLKNLNPYGSRNSITINTVDELQYRINGGDWIVGSALGGYVATVSEVIVVDEPGAYTIDFRTVHTRTGITSNIWSDNFQVQSANQGESFGFVIVNAADDLVTTENGGTASFSVVLSSQPASDVYVGVQSSNTNEAVVSTSMLHFSTSNWHVAQTVVVTGVADGVKDGDQVYHVHLGPTVSSDAAWNNLAVDSVTLTNLDNWVSPGQAKKKEDGGGGGGGNGNKFAVIEADAEQQDESSEPELPPQPTFRENDVLRMLLSIRQQLREAPPSVATSIPSLPELKGTLLDADFDIEDDDPLWQLTKPRSLRLRLFEV
jgi:hypothetical protein